MELLFLEDALDHTHKKVATAILELFWKKEGSNRYGLLYSNNKYYKWNNKKLLWELEQSAQGQSSEIYSFNELIKLYETIRENDNKRISDSDDKGERANLEIHLKKVASLITKLNTLQYMSNVWYMVIKMITDNTFEENRDPVTPLIPTSDGKLFNIFTHESRIRNKDDLYTYTIDASFDDSIKSIQPEKLLYDDSLKTSHDFAWKFFYDFMSRNLERTLHLIELMGIYISGDCRDTTFAQFIGQANNGKSTFFNVLKMILAASAKSVSEKLVITRDGKSNETGPNPELLSLKHARLAYMAETNEGGYANTSFIKRLGQDVQSARGCHSNDVVEKIYNCHLIICSQHLLAFNSEDEAMKKRTRVIRANTWYKPQKSTYVNHNPDLEIPQDRLFEAKLKMFPDYRNAIFTIMALGAKQYADRDFNENLPDEVAASSLNYAADSFRYKDFVDDVCEFGEEKYIVHAPSFYQTYEKYILSDTSIVQKPDSKNTFYKIMAKKFGEKKKVGKRAIDGKDYEGKEYFIGVQINTIKLQAYIDEKEKQSIAKRAKQLDINNKAQDVIFHQNSTEVKTEPKPKKEPVFTNNQVKFNLNESKYENLKLEDFNNWSKESKIAFLDNYPTYKGMTIKFE